MAPLLQLEDDVLGISDDEILLRRVPFTTLGGNNPSLAGTVAKLSPNAFRDRSTADAASYGFAGPCMSIAFLSILTREHKTPADYIASFPDYGLASVTVGALRKLLKADGTPCPQGVMRAPKPDEPWHGVVFDLSGAERPDPVKKSIARSAVWEISLVHHV